MTYYVFDGKLCHAGDDIEIKSPAVLICKDLINPECSTVLRCGEAEILRKELRDKSRLYSKAGLGKLVLITMDSEVPAEVSCYIFRRCLEFSATRFPAQLEQHLDDGTIESWIRDEMLRLPLD